ncbi:hypothetical protein LCGC14_1299600 [marine sediment metagenome]|uniref:Uncharacterized protein n=1 Tax=marine sediment metagenome TaxID=412755 RepID=A0A0F9KQE9_9ZZZZ
MPRPICVQCGVEMRPTENGVFVCVHDDDGEPYEVWSGDKFGCPRCDGEVVVGFGKKAVSSHFKEGFEEWVLQSDVAVKRWDGERA